MADKCNYQKANGEKCNAWAVKGPEDGRCAFHHGKEKKYIGYKKGFNSQTDKAPDKFGNMKAGYR
jgi:hypothetical protein